MTLSQLVKKSETSRRIFENLRSRERFRAVTDLRLLYYDLSEKQEIDPVEFISTFKQLQELGAGKLERGHENSADKFFWKYNLKEVVKAADTGYKDLSHLTPLSKITKRRLDNPIAKAEAALEESKREEELRRKAKESEREDLEARRKTGKKGKQKTNAQDYYRDMLSKMSPEQTQQLLLELLQKTATK